MLPATGQHVQKSGGRIVSVGQGSQDGELEKPGLVATKEADGGHTSWTLGA